ncbi:MAG TPA: hypothetical protein VEQ62_05985 [Stellaceae bacterium]|nr:hypothetical protein [Stellaceae bacterium]
MSADERRPTPEALSRAEHAYNLWLAGTGTPEDFLRPAQRIALICEIAEALDDFRRANE